MSVISQLDRRQRRAARKQSLLIELGPTHRMPDAAHLQWLQLQGVHYVRSLRRLMMCFGTPEFHGALYRHCTSFTSRVSAIAHMATHRLDLTLSPQRLNQLANEIEFNSRPIPTHVVEIPHGDGYRETVNFNDVDYARLLILGDVLALIEERLFPSDSYEPFSLAGMGGSHHCIKRTLQLIESGQRLFAYGDIHAAFPSVRPTMLTSVIALETWALRLLFPGEGLGDVGADTTRGEPTTISTSVPANALRGAPQGSPSSKSVLGLVFGSVVHPMAAERVIIQIADEVLASALTRTDAEAFLERVRNELHASYLGGLRLGRSCVVDLDAGKPLEFLGYHICFTEGGERLIVEPSQKALRKWRRKCAEKLLEKYQQQPRPNWYDLYECAYEYFIMWSNSFAEWRADADTKASWAFNEAGRAVEEFERHHDVVTPPLVPRVRRPVDASPPTGSSPRRRPPLIVRDECSKRIRPSVDATEPPTKARRRVPRQCAPVRAVAKPSKRIRRPVETTKPPTEQARRRRPVIRVEQA